MTLLLAALIASATPSPSPAPTPRTITHEFVYPICKVLRTNLGQSIQAVLANDQAIEASKPLIVDMGRNAESMHPISQTGLGNLHAPAPLGEQSAGSVLDENRLERIIGTLQHNIEITKQNLKDPALFPVNPQTSSDRQAVRLKGLLEDVLAQQEALLNVYEGLLDSRQTAGLAARGDPLAQLFQIDKPEVLSRSSQEPLQPVNATTATATTFQNPKTQGGDSSLVSGPLSPLPGQIYNPEFSKSSVPGLENSLYGRFYQAVDLQQGRITLLETALAIRIIVTTRECSGTPAMQWLH
jgi:hypothetical protein